MSTAVRITLLSIVGHDCDCTRGHDGHAAFAADQPAANLAIVAKPSTSYISGDTKLSGAQRRFRSAAFRRMAARQLRQLAAHGYAVGRVRVEPADQHRQDRRLLVGRRARHSSAQGKPVAVLGTEKTSFSRWRMRKGLGVERDKYNTTTFDKVKTPKLRLEIDADGRNSTGMLEWKVL